MSLIELLIISESSDILNVFTLPNWVQQLILLLSFTLIKRFFYQKLINFESCKSNLSLIIDARVFIFRVIWSLI